MKLNWFVMAATICCFSSGTESVNLSAIVGVEVKANLEIQVDVVLLVL